MLKEVKKAQVDPHGGYAGTALAIVAMAKKYASDLHSYADTDPRDFFELVRRIPYRMDEAIPFLGGKNPGEILARPGLLLNNDLFPALDCKKKSLLQAAQAEMAMVPWRLVVIQEVGASDFHHIFPQIKVFGKWHNADATFPEYFFGQSKPNVLNAEVFQ